MFGTVSFLGVFKADDKSMMRRTEKMFGLLAIALTLCPCRIDETIMTKLTEKHADRSEMH